MKNVLGVFCNSDVSNNEELKAQLRKKNVFMVLLLIISGLAMLGLIIYESNGGEYVGDKNGWFYRGACTGIAFAAVIFLFRNLNTIKDEKKLTELRIEITDERNIAINAAAVKAESKAQWEEAKAMGSPEKRRELMQAERDKQIAAANERIAAAQKRINK